MIGARVIVLAGPSGAGKSRLAARLGVPVLRLDDFYRDADDPLLPRVEQGTSKGIVDWDDPRSWHLHAALTSIRSLCSRGVTEVPRYDLSTSRRTGTQVLDLAGHDRFVAEGIFAPEVVHACRAEGLLAAAFCVTQHPVRTFTRRLVRDLRERRKPPLTLLRRGIDLMREQHQVVDHARRLGCAVVTPEEAWTALVRRPGTRVG